jgi:hypothetical protein
VFSSTAVLEVQARKIDKIKNSACITIFQVVTPRPRSCSSPLSAGDGSLVPVLNTTASLFTFGGSGRF